MLFFIIFGVLILVGIVLSFKDIEELGIVFTVLGITIECILALLLVTAQSRNNQTIVEYESTKVLIESYNGKEYGNVPALTEKIIELNQEIAWHKGNVDSPWFGIWIDKNIVKLEPLTFVK